MINYKTPSFRGYELFDRTYSALIDTPITEDERLLLCDTIYALKKIEPSLDENKLIERASTITGISPLSDEFARENNGAKALCSTQLRAIMLNPSLSDNEKITSLLHEYIHLLGKENGLEGIDYKYINEITVQRISWDVSQVLGIENDYKKVYPDGLTSECYGIGYDHINTVSETMFDLFGKTEVYKALLDDGRLSPEGCKKDFIDLAGTKLKEIAERQSLHTDSLNVFGLKLKALPAIMEDSGWSPHQYLELSKKYQDMSPYFERSDGRFQPTETLIANDALFLAKLHGIDTAIISQEFNSETQSEEMTINSFALSMLRNSERCEEFSVDDFRNALVYSKKTDTGYLICLKIGNEEFKGIANAQIISDTYVSATIPSDFSLDGFTLQALAPPMDREPITSISRDIVESDTLIYHQYFGGLDDSSNNFLKLLKENSDISGFDIKKIGPETFENYLRMGFSDKIFRDQRNFDCMSTQSFPDGKTILHIAAESRPNSFAFAKIVNMAKEGVFCEGLNPNMTDSKTGKTLVDSILAEMGKDDRSPNIEKTCDTETYMSKKRDELYEALSDIVEAGGKFTNKSIELIRQNGDFRTVMLAARHNVPIDELLKGADLKVFIQNNEPVACGYLGPNGQYEIVDRTSLPPKEPQLISEALKAAQNYGGGVVEVKRSLLSGSYEIDGTTYKCQKSGLQPKDIDSILMNSWSKSIAKGLSQNPDFMIESKGHFYLIGLNEVGDISLKKEVPPFAGAYLGTPHLGYEKSINILQYDKEKMTELRNAVQQKAAEK